MRQGTFFISGLFSLALLAWPSIGKADHWPHEELSINLSLSGGGTRAAAFAHGVLLELDEIRLCWKPTEQPNESELVVFYTRRTAETTTNLCDNSSTRTLLEELQTLSGVSGGAITASYYKASKGNEWKRSFRDVLLSKNMELELLARIQSNSALLPDALFRPALAITSIVDVAKYFATLPFKLTGIKAGFMNPDFTPALFLASGQGLIKPDEMTEVYRDWILSGINKNLTFGDLSKGELGKNKPPKLLINATDIKNGSIFTFDENTFTCMGLTKSDYEKFPISRALAASSALPVIFSPHNLSDLVQNARPEQVTGENCAILSADFKRAPLLLDGGIVENLGLAKLLQEAFWRKNHKWNPHHNAAEQTFLISVNAAVQGGSGLPTLGKGSTIPQDLDQSFDVLMTNKTDVTRTIFESALSPFGFRFIELRFPDISRTNTSERGTDLTTERVALARLGIPFATRLSKAELTRMAEESSLFRQEKEKVFQDLNSIGMAPTKEQIDLLISAGRAVVADRFDEIKEQLLGLTEQRYQEICGDILNITKAYCWPNELTDKDLLRSPLRVVLSRFDTVKEQHVKHIAANRARAIASLRDNMRANLLEEVKEEQKIYADAGWFMNSFLCLGARRDLSYFTLYKDTKKVAALEELLARCKKIQTKWDYLARNDEAEQRERNKPGDKAPDTHKEHVYRPSDYTLRAFVEIVQTVLNESPSIETTLPEYYAFLLGSAKLIYLDDPTGLTLLYRGRNHDPMDLNINEQLGTYMILKRSEYARGLRHIHAALESTRTRITKLQEDLGQLNLTAKSTLNPSISLLKEQQDRFTSAEHYYKKLFSRLYTTSPTPIEIDGMHVSEQEIADWLNTHYPDGNGGTVVGLLGAQEHEKNALSHRRCLLKEIVASIELNGRDELNTCKRSEDEQLAEMPGKYLTDVKELMKTIRAHAMKDIAKSSGLKLALQYAEEAYRDSKTHDHDKYLYYERSLYWGLALLVASAEATCPDRGSAVEKASQLIKEGVAHFLTFTPKDMSEARQKRIERYSTLPEYFACVRNGAS